MCNSREFPFSFIFSFIGIGVGVSAFFIFFSYQNIEAGSWALASAVFAAVAFNLHYLNYHRTLDSWHDTETLQGIQFLGLMVMTIGIAGTIWYIFCAVYYSIPMLPVSHSAYISAVWSLMTAKWGLVLLIIGKIYTNVIRRENPRLLSVS